MGCIVVRRYKQRDTMPNPKGRYELGMQPMPIFSLPAAWKIKQTRWPMAANLEVLYGCDSTGWTGVRLAIQLPVSKGGVYARNYAFLHKKRRKPNDRRAISFSIEPGSALRASNNHNAYMDSDTLTLVLVLGFQRLLWQYGQSDRIALIPSIMGSTFIVNKDRYMEIPAHAEWVIAVVNQHGHYVSIAHHRESGSLFCMNSLEGDCANYVAAYLRTTRQTDLVPNPTVILPVTNQGHTVNCGYASALNALFLSMLIIRSKDMTVDKLIHAFTTNPHKPTKADYKQMRSDVWRTLSEWTAGLLQKENLAIVGVHAPPACGVCRSPRQTSAAIRSTAKVYAEHFQESGDHVGQSPVMSRCRVRSVTGTKGIRVLKLRRAPGAPPTAPPDRAYWAPESASDRNIQPCHYV